MNTKKIWLGAVSFMIISMFLLGGCLETKSVFPSTVSIDIKQAYDKDNIVPIAIIGSGSAGLSAAIYGARSKIPTIVIGGSEPGGLLTKTTQVENYPGFVSILGPDLMKNMRTQAEQVGAQFLNDVVESVDINQWPFVIRTESGKTLNALSVIVATGALPRKLGVAGEEEYWGSGVTSCAICDAPFFKNEDVVVVGGGDSAIEEALQLAPYVRTATILVRKDRMRAAESMQDRLKGYTNINVMYNVAIDKIIGDGNKVTGVELIDMQTKKHSTLSASGVFLAIGHDPNSKIFKGIMVDDAGYIMLQKESQATSVLGIFAAGEVEDHRYRQAIVAAGKGAGAALDAVAFLTNIGWNAVTAQQCDQHLFVPNKIIRTGNVMPIRTIEEFEQLKNSEKLVVFDFFAKTCPTCMHMLPVIESVAQEMGEKAVFVKVDTDESPELVKKLFVHKVPCLIVFNKGNLVARYNNIMTHKELVLFIGQFLI